MRILMWHLHGSYATSLLQGRHEFLLPVLPDRGSYGRGRARTWTWPATAIEVTPSEAARSEVDLVVLQRPEELELAQAWLGGRRPGRDVPAVFLEHNAPQGPIAEMRHPLADQSRIPIVHVTHFNALFWDTGRARSTVVEHGVVDPGHRYTGELVRGVASINEPARRGRVTGTDLLPTLGEALPLDLFGIRAEEVGGVSGLSQQQLHAEMSRRRAYVHPFRWTSLGLSLIEAMLLGMPVVALATTEAGDAVPPGAGFLSNRIDVLRDGLRQLAADHAAARAMGLVARAAARDRYGIERFLGDWDDVFAESVAEVAA